MLSARQNFAILSVREPIQEIDEDADQGGASAQEAVSDNSHLVPPARPNLLLQPQPPTETMNFPATNMTMITEMQQEKEAPSQSPVLLVDDSDFNLVAL